jgi:hypothetical protein
MKVISKISAKTLKAFPRMKFVEVNGKPTPRADGDQFLFRIIGRAVDVKKGNSDYGSWTAFSGDFRATLANTGEVFQSSKVFLPDSITGILESALASSVGGADFAFDVGVTEAETPMGYQYTVASLIAMTAESDPLAALLAQVAAQAPALPAPAVPAVTQLELTTEPTVEPALENAPESKKKSK